MAPALKPTKLAPLVDYEDEEDSAFINPPTITELAHSRRDDNGATTFGMDLGGENFDDGGDVGTMSSSTTERGLTVRACSPIGRGTTVVQIPPTAILSYRNVFGGGDEAGPHRPAPEAPPQRLKKIDLQLLHRPQRSAATSSFPDAEGEDATGPYGALSNSKSSSLSSANEEAVTAQRQDANLALALALLNESRKGSSSRWFGYLQSLPEHEPPLAIFWRDHRDGAAALHCIRNTQLERRLRSPDTEAQLTSIRQYYETFARDAYQATWREFRRAYALVSSRAFWVDVYQGLALVPVADAFNHTEENHVHLETDWYVCATCGSLDSCEHDEEETGPEIPLRSRTSTAARIAHTYDMVAERAIAPGEEVFNTYDSRGISNVELLYRYGFILDGNGQDAVEFDENELSAVFVWRKLQPSLGYDEKEGDLRGDRQMERFGQQAIIATTHSPASAVPLLPSTSEEPTSTSHNHSKRFPGESSSPPTPRVCGPSVAPGPTPGRVDVVIDAVRALFVDADLVQRQSNPPSNLCSLSTRSIQLDPAGRLDDVHSKPNPYEDRWGEIGMNWQRATSRDTWPRAAHTTTVGVGPAGVYKDENSDDRPHAPQMLPTISTILPEADADGVRRHSSHEDVIGSKYVREEGFAYAIDAEGLASDRLWTRLVGEALRILDGRGSPETSSHLVLSTEPFHGSHYEPPEVGSGEAGLGPGSHQGRTASKEEQQARVLRMPKQGFEETLSTNAGIAFGDGPPARVRTRVREEVEGGLDGNRPTKRRHTSASDSYTYQSLPMRTVCEVIGIGKREDDRDGNDEGGREDEEEGRYGDCKLLKVEESYQDTAARLVGEMMLELCTRRLDSMADEDELERTFAGPGAEDILGLATSYVRNERAILLACKARWQAFVSDEEDDESSGLEVSSNVSE